LPVEILEKRRIRDENLHFFPFSIYINTFL